MGSCDALVFAGICDKDQVIEFVREFFAETSSTYYIRSARKERLRHREQRLHVTAIAEINAICSVWPQIKVFLCWFHVRQAIER